MSAIVKTTTTTGTFVPTSVSGCQLWLDGADSSTITMATGVSQWNDKSGNTYNLTQSTTGSQPTRTGNYVIFQSNNYLNIPQAAINNAAAFSIFLVFNPISSLNWIIQKQADGIATQNMLSMSYYWIQNVGSTAYVYWTSTANQGPFANSGTALTLSTLQLLELTYDGTTLVIYRNGTVLSSTAGAYSLPNYTTATNCTLGAWIASGSPYNSGSTNFQLGELLHYNTFPSTTNRQSIEGYLAQKWGLTSSLPAGHPGLTTAFYGALTVPMVSLQKYKIYAAPRAVAITTKQKIVYNSVAIIYQLITLTTTATTFSYTGADQTFTAPANVYAVVAYIWGAGGGGSGQPGGAGAFAQVVVPVTPGQTYTIIVGQGGTQTSSATYGGGGFGYVGNAWAGGGRSAIRYSSADIVTLGAGAGSGQDSGSTGGVANWSPLVNSGNGYDATAAQHASLVSGKGGTQTAGGAGGAPDGGVGSAYQGGAGGLNYGGTGGTGGAPTGGGGSGYYGGGGGGGGASGPYNCTGGGGGSSLLNNVIPITGGNSPNAQAQAPGTSSSYYSGTIATGGTSGAGGNGKVVLTYATASSQIQGLTMSLSGTTVTMTWSASSYATSYYWALYYNTTNSSTGGVLNNYGSTSSVTATATVSTSGYYYFAVSGLNASGGVSQIAFSSVIQK